MSSYSANKQASNGMIDNTSNFAGSSLLENYGNYIGGIVNVGWLVAAYYLFMHIHKQKIIKNIHYLGPASLVLLSIADNIYYFKATKTADTKKNVNSIYANIAFIPIYISILIFAIMVASKGAF